MRTLATSLILTAALGVAGCSDSPFSEPEVSSISSFDILTADGQQVLAALSEDGRVILRGFNFATDSAELSPEGQAALAVLGPALTGVPGITTNLAIVGHTDNTGDFNANIALSQRRAKTIVDALVADYGVAIQRLAAVGVGPIAPVDSNTTESGRANNRRVELVVVN